MKRIRLLIIIVLAVFIVTLAGCEFNFNLNGGESQSGSSGSGSGSGNSGSGADLAHPHQTVNFFTVNDIHGRLITDSEVGIEAGLDKVSTLLKQLTSADDYIKISNGDMFQGSQFSNYLYGLPAIEWMNLENFDCFVLGNHEFDWGIEKIAAYKDGNLENGELNEDCEVLGCNIYLKATNAMPDWIEAYSIEECNGYKVGVIGCIGEGLTSSIAASMAKDYEFVDPVPLVKEYAKKLRTEDKCDVVIVSIHQYDTYVNERFAALTGDSRIDAIICGHSHTQNKDYVTRSDSYVIPVIQCRGYNGSVGTINLQMKDGAPVSRGTITHYNPTRYASDSTAYDLLFARYKDIKESNSVIAYSSRNLSKETLGYLCCDAMMEKYGAEVGICNTGGIRATIEAGEISYSDVYNVFPFDNTVFVITMKGSDLVRAINSSLYANVDTFDTDKVYTVALISYVYENYNDFTSKAIDVTDTTVLVRDVVAEYLSENYPIQ
ncbi:MAG: 5'-nucleotidase C-terminal domain-containing protein [Bacilli bacterium]|nr:5'-nucleotidase C-terminal domain-containing protein [Bacilli bacterium]